MKELLSKEFDVGSDAKGKAALVVDELNLKAEVSISYPTEKIIEPATKAFDKALDKLEQLIPGDWDKPIIDRAKQEFKEALLELLTK